MEACVKALLLQDLPSPIIITTSTPSGYIEQIAKKYELPYYITNQPGSIAGDWNFALSKTTTRLVTIAHQDDIYEKNYSREIITAFKKYEKKHPQIIFTDYTDIVNNVERKTSLNAIVKNLMLMPFWFKPAIQSRWLKKTVLALGDPVCCPSVTIDRVNTNNLLFSKDYTCVLDWAAWLQLAHERGAFVFVSKKLVQHRIHIDSETTNQIKNGKRLQEETAILSSIWGQRIAGLLSRLYARGHSDNKV